MTKRRNEHRSGVCLYGPKVLKLPLLLMPSPTFQRKVNVVFFLRHIKFQSLCFSSNAHTRQFSLDWRWWGVSTYSVRRGRRGASRGRGNQLLNWATPEPNQTIIRVVLSNLKVRWNLHHRRPQGVGGAYRKCTEKESKIRGNFLWWSFEKQPTISTGSLRSGKVVSGVCIRARLSLLVRSNPPLSQLRSSIHKDCRFYKQFKPLSLSVQFQLFAPLVSFAVNYLLNWSSLGVCFAYSIIVRM